MSGKPPIRKLTGGADTEMAVKRLRVEDSLGMPGQTFTRPFPAGTTHSAPTGRRVSAGVGFARMYHFISEEQIDELVFAWPYETLGSTTVYKEEFPPHDPDYFVKNVKRMLSARRWDLVWYLINGAYYGTAYLKRGWEASAVGTDVLIVDTSAIETWGVPPSERVLALCAEELAPFKGPVDRAEAPPEIWATPEDVPSSGNIGSGGLDGGFPTHWPDDPPINGSSTVYTRFSDASSAGVFRYFRDFEGEFLYSSITTSATWAPDPFERAAYYYVSSYSSSPRRFLRKWKLRYEGYSIVSDEELPLADYGTQYLHTYQTTNADDNTQSKWYSDTSPEIKLTDTPNDQPSFFIPTARRRFDTGEAYFSGDYALYAALTRSDTPAAGVGAQLDGFGAKQYASQPRATWSFLQSPDEMVAFTDPASKLKYTLNTNGEFKVVDTQSVPPGGEVFRMTLPADPAVSPTFGSFHHTAAVSATNTYVPFTIYTVTFEGVIPVTTLGLHHRESATLKAVLVGGQAYVPERSPPVVSFPPPDGALFSIGRKTLTTIYTPATGAFVAYNAVDNGYSEHQPIRDAWVDAFVAGDKETMAVKMEELIGKFTLVYRVGGQSDQFLMGCDEEYIPNILI